MIELPSGVVPSEMEVLALDQGSVVRGASSLRIDRPGNRYAIGFTFPPSAEPKVARIVRAKRQGIRVYLPLKVPQGSPGTPVVDGAGQSGTSLDVRGFTPGYFAKEDYWLTIIDASGNGYLHQVAETVGADGTGSATLSIEPPLRAPFADGATIEFAKPYIEGFIDGENWGWNTPTNWLVSIGLVVEEYE